MSNVCAYLSSTVLLVSDERALEQLVREHFGAGNVSPAIEAVDDGFVLGFDPEDVPMSYADRIDAFCDASESVVSAPFEILLRSDEMNDDRDRYFYGGSGDIEGFAAECRLKRALECLAPGDAAARQALEMLLGERAVGCPDRQRG